MSCSKLITSKSIPITLTRCTKWCFSHKMTRSYTQLFTNQRHIHHHLHTHSIRASSAFSIDTTKWLLRISESQPVLACQSYIEVVHNTLNIPWWATIILCTIGLRMLVTFPVMIYQQIMVARLQNLQPEIKQLAQELKVETAQAAQMYNWSENHSRYMFNRSLKNLIRQLIERDNCHPFKSVLVVLIQMPLWITVSFALRNMVYMMPASNMAAEVLFLELSVGGWLWFSNLTIPDQYWILPILFGVLNLAIVEVHTLKKVKMTPFHNVLTNATRGISIFMIFVAANVPSCLALYWTTSSFLGLCQNVALQFPSFRRACRIPGSPIDSQ